MAQPPDINETFVREVDENLRRDQVQDFFKKYGGALAAAVILFLAASGGLIWWKQHRLERHQQEVEKLAQIYKDAGSGSLRQVDPQLKDLSASSSKAVRAEAQFVRAALALQQSDSKTAIATYKALASDGGLPAPYRNAALIRETALEFDQLQPQEIISRLQPLAKPGEPWFGTAGEMTALAMMKQGQRQQAAQLFAAIAKDNGVPQAIRIRSAGIAGSLGVDVSAEVQAQAQ